MCIQIINAINSLVYQYESLSSPRKGTTHCAFQLQSTSDGVQAVSDLYQLQGALVWSWHGAAQESEGMQPFQKRGHEWTTATVVLVGMSMGGP